MICRSLRFRTLHPAPGNAWVPHGSGACSPPDHHQRQLPTMHTTYIDKLSRLFMHFGLQIWACVYSSRGNGFGQKTGQDRNSSEGSRLPSIGVQSGRLSVGSVSERGFLSRQKMARKSALPMHSNEVPYRHAGRAMGWHFTFQALLASPGIPSMPPASCQNFAKSMPFSSNILFASLIAAA